MIYVSAASSKPMKVQDTAPLQLTKSDWYSPSTIPVTSYTEASVTAFCLTKYCSAAILLTEDTSNSTPLLSINSVVGVVLPAAAKRVLVVATGLQILASDLLRLLFVSSRCSLVKSPI